MWTWTGQTHFMVGPSQGPTKIELANIIHRLSCKSQQALGIQKVQILPFFITKITSLNMRPVGLVCVWVAVRLNFFVACYKRSEYFSRGQGALRKASVFQADLNIGLDWIY